MKTAHINQKKDDKLLILASQSPRRKEILTSLCANFIVHPSNFIEKDTDKSPKTLVIYNAKGKATEVASHYKSGIIIGVDTVVVLQEDVINKPKDDDDARNILQKLSGKTHEVISGIAIYRAKTDVMYTETVTTQITMGEITESEIDAYIKTGEGRDKAGAYAVQGIGALFIKEIKGDYFNVVGLPIFTLNRILKKLEAEIL